MINEKGYIDVNSALKLKEAEGRVEVDKMNAESDAKFRELLIRESAKETASKSPTESGACAAIAIVDATALGILEVYVN